MAVLPKRARVAEIDTSLGVAHWVFAGMMVRQELPLQSYSISIDIYVALKRLLWRHNSELGWHHVNINSTISSLKQIVLGLGFFYLVTCYNYLEEFIWEFNKLIATWRYAGYFIV